jgi:hypothetical protein
LLAEAAHKHQAEVAALKLVQARPHKPLHNLINQPRSKHIVVQVVSAVVSIVVEVKILLRVHYEVLAAIFNRLIEVGGPCPFSRALLRGPLVYSDFGLNSITYTIIKIKT